MAPLPQPANDPTLAAIDGEIEARENGNPAREYLGMSGIGHSCERKSWMDWRWVSRVQFRADTLKRFADGHHGEDVQADRLRMVDGITLLTVNPENGRQWGVSDIGGHFKGHMDGALLGLLQAPKTWHVWEHKQVEEKKQAKLEKLKAEKGEKQALAAWDAIYYAQAILYMHYSGMDRHYLTCATPGGRRTISVRTEANTEDALRLLAKAERIIGNPSPPARISADPSWFECRFCPHSEACHGDATPDRHCRSCLHSTPVADGAWQCERQGMPLDTRTQRAGCAAHLFIPALIHGEQIDAGEDFVTYRMRDGEEWRDGVLA